MPWSRSGLEIHRSIKVALPGGAAELPVLPPYVSREHDELLAAVVAEAVAGSSGIAVLVGGSSTGKTRACWEAVQALPAEWRLWHPIGMSRPKDVVEGLSRVRPRTVVWLNEIQIYLNAPGGLGEQVAAGLQELMRDPRRGPVLILGTIWPDYWEGLCAPATRGKLDPHAQVRMLLTGTGIEVSDSFTACEITALRDADDTDPRIIEALERAQDRQISQYLAGVPVLLERYRTASAPTKALIQATIELRLLGHDSALPQALLVAAAAFIGESQWCQAVDEGWPEKSFTEIIRPRLGVSGPLVRIRPRFSHAALAEPHYRLADYLDQIACTLRTSPLDRDVVLTAVFVHASADNVAQMAHVETIEAEYYIALYQQEERTADAIAWLRARISAGPYLDSMYIFSALEQEGRIWEALCWEQRIAELRNEPQSMWDQVQILSWNHLETVLRWLNDQIDSGHVAHYTTAYLGLMARTLRDAGRIDEAIIWYRRAAKEFDHEASFWLLALLLREGRKEEAYAVLQPRIDAGDPDALEIAEAHGLRRY
jgi:tetratricopeptide (TPR) repeat protein